MNGTVDDRYLEWLYSKIAVVRNTNPRRSWWSLARRLYMSPFTWFVPNDDNRAADGIALRREFAESHGVELPEEWVTLECSMLEMLIALARRASFDSHGSAAEWFWKMMENVELQNYTDDVYEISIEETVDEVVARINERTYGPTGYGGLFPLQYARQDQRRVELYYQLQAYLLEGLYVGISNHR